MENAALQKEKLTGTIDQLKERLVSLSTFIYRNPELGFTEVKASKALTDFLKENGFEVELGYAGLPTAFRAVYKHGEGGPTIGLLCEYDALKNLGHGCGHHLQGPAIVGAALAIKKDVQDYPYTLEVIGTPGEECPNGGKNIMLENGAFKELDVALMMHASDTTTTDVRSLAMVQYRVTYHGVSAHAAIAPEKGRNALDGVLMAFNGMNYLRGHVKEDVRMSGVIENGGRVTNVIPDTATAAFEARSFDAVYLDDVVERLLNVFKGAALMTATTVDIEKIGGCRSKVPVLTLNDVLMNNAKLVKAPCMAPPRLKTGSTDFATVMFNVPGSCIRSAFIAKGNSAHSKAWLDQGVKEEAWNALVVASKVLALSVLDVVSSPALLQKIKDEFAAEKAKLGK